MNPHAMNKENHSSQDLLSIYFGENNIPTNGQAVNSINKMLSKGDKVILDLSNNNTVVAKKLSYIWIILIVIIFMIIFFYVFW